MHWAKLEGRQGQMLGWFVLTIISEPLWRRTRLRRPTRLGLVHLSAVRFIPTDFDMCWVDLCGDLWE